MRVHIGELALELHESFITDFPQPVLQFLLELALIDGLAGLGFAGLRGDVLLATLLNLQNMPAELGAHGAVNFTYIGVQHGLLKLGDHLARAHPVQVAAIRAGYRVV